MTLADCLRGRETIVLDGAMGTELDRRGCSARCEANLTHPDTVEQVHRDYIRSGATAIITNTLTTTRLFAESHGLAVDVEKVNREGARVARRAAGGKGFVLGNLSSTGQMLEPYGSFSEREFVETFKEQAGFLAEEGVDGFIIETMMDLGEAVCALRACKAVSPLPTIVCMAFSTRLNGGRTAMGNSAQECVRALSDNGADAIGANCGSVDPREMAEVVSIIASSSRVPVAAEPNAGKPRVAGGLTVFDMGPDAFAAGLLQCKHSGASILGGCCGTTPEHIRAFAAMLKA